MLLYGIFLKSVDGVKANKKEAALYLQKSADLGNSEEIIQYMYTCSILDSELKNNFFFFCFIHFILFVGTALN